MDKGFVLTDYDHTELFEIPSFKKTGLVSHGFSTRVGGVGKAPYDTLNLALHVDDDPATVIENRKIVCRILGADINGMVAAQQVHGVNIEVAGQQHAGLGALSYDTAFPDTDGIITDRPGLLLATFYADCVPIFILDPVKKIIASVHSGWQGTAARIGAVALEKMRIVFGCDPADCLVGIGPSIGPCCYEIGKSVIDVLRREFIWWSDVICKGKTGLSYLNLWETNLRIMIEAGVRSSNIEVAETCTCCNRHMLFSYRGSGGITGRMGAFLMLKGYPAEGGN